MHTIICNQYKPISNQGSTNENVLWRDQSDTPMSDTSIRSTKSFYKAGTVSGSNNC